MEAPIFPVSILSKHPESRKKFFFLSNHPSKLKFAVFRFIANVFVLIDRFSADFPTRELNRVKKSEFGVYPATAEAIENSIVGETLVTLKLLFLPKFRKQ